MMSTRRKSGSSWTMSRFVGSLRRGTSCCRPLRRLMQMRSGPFERVYGVRKTSDSLAWHERMHSDDAGRVGCRHECRLSGDWGDRRIARLDAALSRFTLLESTMEIATD